MVTVMRKPPTPISAIRVLPPRPSMIRRSDVGNTARHSAMVVRMASPRQAHGNQRGVAQQVAHEHRQDRHVVGHIEEVTGAAHERHQHPHVDAVDALAVRLRSRAERGSVHMPPAQHAHAGDDREPRRRLLPGHRGGKHEETQKLAGAQRPERGLGVGAVLGVGLLVTNGRHRVSASSCAACVRLDTCSALKISLMWFFTVPLADAERARNQFVAHALAQQLAHLLHSRA